MKPQRSLNHSHGGHNLVVIGEHLQTHGACEGKGAGHHIV